jgi:ferredoxin-NADP reductase
MAGGDVSPYLSGRQPGDSVRVSPPFGWFRPGEHAAERPFVFVATGTGIAPFLSYFRSRPGKSRRGTCLYGVRHFEDAVDTGWLARQCDFRLAVSREEKRGAHHGRVTDLLRNLPGKTDTDYYLCGLDAMIDDTTALLEARGVPLVRIHRECFFNSSY